MAMFPSDDAIIIVFPEVFAINTVEKRKIQPMQNQRVDLGKYSALT
jgi:hypothetical protein